MANLQEPLCSWDSTIDERYNDYTTGNTDEVLPGITRPLPADLIREWNYQWLVVGTRELQIEDLVPIPDKPGTTMLPVVGGQFCVNISVVNALTSSFETGGSADYLKQFFEGEEEITAEVAQDTSRAEAVQERLMARFVRARASSSMPTPTARRRTTPPPSPATGPPSTTPASSPPSTRPRTTSATSSTPTTGAAAAAASRPPSSTAS